MAFQSHSDILCETILQRHVGSWQQKIKKAKFRYGKKRFFEYNRAGIFLELYLMLEDQVTTHIHEIEALKQQERYKEALEKIQKLLYQFTDDYRLYEEMADIYLYEGDMKKAEGAVKLAQELHPDSATGKYLMGYIHISKNHFKK